MDEFRKLVYEDKTSLNDFGVNDMNSLNYLIYAKWLVNRVEIDPFDSNHKEYYIKAFNDSYYLCTLALLLPEKMEIRPDRLLSKIDRPSVVFPMVHLYLSKLSCKSKGIILFLKKLETAFKNRPDWQQNHNELKLLLCKNDKTIDLGLFAQRQQTSEVFSHVDWCSLTETFNKSKIKNIVSNFARNKEVWYIMIKAIETAAQKYDFDYGFENYTEEGIDENGPYIRTIKVPKNPYNTDGEEYFEPLKRAGVFQFCAELITKFDELSVKTQPMDAVIEGIEDPSPISADKSCFRFITQFVKEKMKDICKLYYQGSHANLALIEKRLFEKEWLKKSNSHKAFVKELVSWGILPPLDDEKIKKITQGMADKMRDLKSGCNQNDYKIFEGIDTLTDQTNSLGRK